MSVKIAPSPTPSHASSHESSRDTGPRMSPAMARVLGEAMAVAQTRGQSLGLAPGRAVYIPSAPGAPGLGPQTSAAKSDMDFYSGVPRGGDRSVCSDTSEPQRAASVAGLALGVAFSDGANSYGEVSPGPAAAFSCGSPRPMMSPRLLIRGSSSAAAAAAGASSAMANIDEGLDRSPPLSARATPEEKATSAKIANESDQVKTKWRRIIEQLNKASAEGLDLVRETLLKIRQEIPTHIYNDLDGSLLREDFGLTALISYMDAVCYAFLSDAKYKTLINDKHSTLTKDTMAALRQVLAFDVDNPPKLLEKPKNDHTIRTQEDFEAFCHFIRLTSPL